MKTLLLAGALALAAVSVSGCTSLGQQGSADLLKQIDTNFAQCDRHITFQAGVGVVTPGAQVSGSVDCKGNGVAPAAAVPVSAPAAQ
jgi:hypothetical protein